MLIKPKLNYIDNSGRLRVKGVVYHVSDDKHDTRFNTKVVKATKKRGASKHV